MTLKKIDRKFLIVFFAILLVGAGLRSFQLEKESIWLYEAFTLKSAGGEKISDVISSVKEIENVGPLYYLTLHSFISLFGISEFSLRFLSVVFDVLSIILIYLIASLFFERKIAIFSMFLYSFSFIHILYSQDARAFSMFVFLVLFSSYFFLKIFKKVILENGDVKISDLIFYSIFSLLALYTAQLMLIMIILSDLLLLFLWKGNCKELLKKIRTLLAAQILILVLFFPWYKIFFAQIKTVSAIFGNALANTLGVEILRNNLALILLILLVILLVILLIFLSRHKNRIQTQLEKLWKNDALFFILLFFTAILIILFIDKLRASFFLTRYTLFLCPFFYILLSKRLFSVQRRKQMEAAILIIFFILGFGLYSYYSEPKKADFRGAAEYVSDNQKDGEVIVFRKGLMQMPFDYYYNYYSGSLDEIQLSEKSADNFKHKESYEKIKETLSNSTGIWLIISRDSEFGDYYLSLFRGDFKEDTSKTMKFYNVEVYKFEIKR